MKTCYQFLGAPDIWSGSTLFVNVPFMGRLKMSLEENSCSILCIFFVDLPSCKFVIWNLCSLSHFKAIGRYL